MNKIWEAQAGIHISVDGIDTVTLDGNSVASMMIQVENIAGRS